MHFTWEISAGQVAISVPLAYVVYTVFKISQNLLRYRIEHEILMTDWACRQVPPVKLHELPTRMNKWW